MSVPSVKIIKNRREQPDENRSHGARDETEDRDDQTREKIYGQ
jgi:hypothetical protein